MLTPNIFTLTHTNTHTHTHTHKHTHRGRGDTYCKLVKLLKTPAGTLVSIHMALTHIYTHVYYTIYTALTHIYTHIYYTIYTCTYTRSFSSPQCTHRGRADTYRKLVKLLKTPAGTLVSWFDDRSRCLWA